MFFKRQNLSEVVYEPYVDNDLIAQGLKREPDITRCAEIIPHTVHVLNIMRKEKDIEQKFERVFIGILYAFGHYEFDYQMECGRYVRAIDTLSPSIWANYSRLKNKGKYYLEKEVEECLDLLAYCSLGQFVSKYRGQELDMKAGRFRSLYYKTLKKLKYPEH